MLPAFRNSRNLERRRDKDWFVWKPLEPHPTTNMFLNWNKLEIKLHRLDDLVEIKNYLYAVIALTIYNKQKFRFQDRGGVEFEFT